MPDQKQEGVTDLSSFILRDMEEILHEWEDFARELTSHAIDVMDTVELRDHAEEMLRTIAVDLNAPQASRQSINESRALTSQTDEYTAAERHAADRLSAGFTIEQLIAEYRSLRASVLRLWQHQIPLLDSAKIQDIIRFNEAIDQSLTESITRYSAMLQHSQNLFLAILGHDVRTPLGAINMGAQCFLLDEKLPASSHQTASRILNSNKRIEEIVSDLLDFATTHLGRGIPVSSAEMNLGEVCEDLVEEMRTFHPHHRIVLNKDLDLEVTWDSTRISQAFSNLIANAVQHGSKTDPVTITVSADDEVIVWTIHNNGDVISPDKLRTIFDPAKRFTVQASVEGNSPHHQHLGLGLYITREIIDAHGGKIDIASDETDGTTFTVRLPRHAPHTPH